MAKYLVMVPVTLDGPVPDRRFRVEVDYNGEITKDAVAEMRRIARNYVAGKKIIIRDNEKIEIYRKNPRS